MDYDMSILIAHQQQQQQQLQEAQAEAMEEVMGDALNAKQKNTLPLYGNKETMNINPMILSNIQGSAYFKEELYKMKTFHEVIDEIFYKVEHLEPWEKGSRKLAGQVGMCGGPCVRGVAAGGIVSSAYCLLYKLFTLKLTRRQVQAMLDHVDSPYIRALGFMYIRYCQPPVDFWDWFEPYLDDPEEIDLKAGGGFKITVGAMCRMMLLKLDWFGTMLPRVSVSVSKTLEQNVKAASQPDRPMPGERERENGGEEDKEPVEREGGREAWGEAARRARPERKERSSPPRRRSRSRSRERNRHERRRSRSRDRGRSHSRERRRSPQRRRSRERSKERPRRSGSHDRRAKSRSRSRERSGRRRSRSRERRRSSRSRSRDRKKKSRSSSRDQRRR